MAPGLDLITPDQLAAELQVKTKTLENWRARQIGPPFLKVNRTVRYSRKAIDTWLADQQGQTRSA